MYIAIPAPHPQPEKNLCFDVAVLGEDVSLGSMSLHPLTEQSRRNVDKDRKLCDYNGYFIYPGVIYVIYQQTVVSNFIF